mgnify:CR=1 FL=1
MKRLLVLLCFIATAAPADECVILLHGLARTANSMSPMAQALQREGYQVANIDYPSRTAPVEELADQAIARGLKQCRDSSGIHFVTHSMGGILVRYYLAHHELKSLQRVVMLGPPNQGSQVVDKLADFPGFRLLNGPAGLQLGTGKASIPNRLGKADFDLGIIAGTRSINLILSTMLPNADDGKVSIANTKLKGMNDHVAMSVTHPFMMRNPKVIEQVIHYLEHGAFKKASD